MLMRFDDTGKVLWWNNHLTEEASAPWIAQDPEHTIWTEDEMPEVEDLEEGKRFDYYYVEGEIEVVIEDVDAEGYTQEEINEAVIALAEVL